MLSELELDEDDVEEGDFGTGIICGAVACRFEEVDVVCGCDRLLVVVVGSGGCVVGLLRFLLWTSPCRCERGGLVGSGGCVVGLLRFPCNSPWMVVVECGGRVNGNCCVVGLLRGFP